MTCCDILKGFLFKTLQGLRVVQSAAKAGPEREIDENRTEARIAAQFAGYGA